MAILALLRGQIPAADAPVDAADDALHRYECGGYLYVAWQASGRIGRLPPGWAAALQRRHRKTAIDNLAALAAFRQVGSILKTDGVPFVLLKGAAYLGDLYDDPAMRALTDIDLLIRRPDAGRVARRLRAEGFAAEVGLHYPENERFEMWRPGEGPCRFEFHWRLGLPHRFGVDTAAIWDRSRPGLLEGLACRRPAPEDALLYHVAHLADHYFGPSLKWIIDLREMLCRWRPSLDRLAEQARAWRSGTALHLALEHLARLFPEEAPRDLLATLAPRPWRRRLLARYRADDPLELLVVPDGSAARGPLRCLMLDRPADALALSARVLLRPLLRPIDRLRGRARPPWEWRDTRETPD
jgi:hypothetical protein